jgi:hypothetical protein
MRRERIFNLGFTISTALLIAVIAGGAGFCEQHETLAESGFHYIATSSAVRWSGLLYVVLNLPAVVIAAVACSILGRLFDLSLGTATVIFLPLALYVSVYWWKWLAKRFGSRVLED